MTKILQLELDFNTQCSSTPHPYFHESPKGYKGLSSFHKYWGKKPIEAWKLLIENLTEPGSIILDPFLGSGLISKECIDRNRRFIGFDINPISIELTNLYLQLPNYLVLKKAVAQLEKRLKDKINQMYLLSNGSIATHFLWDKNKIIKVWTKKGRKRIEVDLTVTEINSFQEMNGYIPQHFREMRLFDNSRINAQKTLSIADLFTPRALQSIDWIKQEIELFDRDIQRALLLILSSSLGQMSKMVFAVSKRGKTKGKPVDKIEVGSWVIGYWKPEKHFEINAWNCFENKAQKLLKAIQDINLQQKAIPAKSLSDFFKDDSLDIYISKGDSETLLQNIPSNTIKVILTDPPHGDRIPYLELSEMWNSVLGFDSDYAGELVVSNAKERQKTVKSYNQKLNNIFSECDRILVDNGLLVIMFNARSQSHWQSIERLEKTTNFTYIGCYSMKYSSGSVVQDNRKGSLKTDFVLLYGKNVNDSFIEKIRDKFKTITNWSNLYPQKFF